MDDPETSLGAQLPSPFSSSAPVLVTGATGNVGRHVVQNLRAAGLPVRAAVSSMATAKHAFGEGHGEGQADITPVVFDFTDPGTWEAAFSGVERMFLMRPPHLSRPKIQMVPALEAARAAGVRHMVLLSLQGAERNRFVPHAALESWLQSSPLSWTFVRASFFMQNLTTTHVSDIRDRDEIVVPGGRGATSFVDAADVAAVASAALLDPNRHRGQAWTPTGSAALTYEEVAEVLTRTLGLVRYARHARQTLHMPWAMVAVTAAIYTVARLGRAGGVTGDVEAVTGRPPTSFEEFATRNAHLWQPLEQRGL